MRPEQAEVIQHVVMLVVRRDGVSVLRLGIPRSLPLLVLGALLVVVTAIGALAAEWWQSRQRVLNVRALLQQIDEQRAIVASFNHRAAELRREVAGRRELHARILEPFGPELSPPAPSAGIGGARATVEDGPASSPSPADELEGLAKTLVQEGDSLRALDRFITRAGKALTALPTRWPVRGAVISEYGNRQSPWTPTREFHAGIDIAAKAGTPVHAPAGGKVVFAGTHGEYGIAVILDHGEDLRTLYGHLSKLSVASGQKTGRGTLLGFTGNTGRSSGPHLHYEVLVKGRAVNPRAYLWN